MLQEKLKQEAIKRLEYLTKEKHLHPDVLKFFNEEGIIYYSERTPLGGMLNWCNDAGGCPRQVQDKIRDLNSKDMLVYHVTHEYLAFGECWDLFVITDEDIDSEECFEDFKAGYQFAWVINMDDDACSEYGTIGYNVDAAGGIVRNA